MTFTDWVSMLREDCSQRQRSARRLAGSDSSSSPFMTDGSWPTPKIVQGGPNSKRKERGAGGADLQEVVANWPTPTTQDASNNGGPSQHDRNSLPLNAAVAQWSTPRASDGEKGGPNQQFGAGGVPLAAQAGQWSTPSVADVTGGRMTRSGDRKDELLLNAQAKAASDFSHQAPQTPPGGQPSSSVGRTLNPQFVEWLMGWPLGWTSFACSETEWSRWQGLMRSALSSLGSPLAAPAQLSLFG